MSPPEPIDWPSYLAGFHSEYPAVTERLLGRLDGRPYEWLIEPLRDTAGLVVDLACGSAPTRDHLHRNRWIGVDLNADELAAAAAAGRGPLARARADALPFPDGSAHSVCAAMCLQVLTPLDAVLAEITRVLRPGGLLTALVPSGLGASVGGWLDWLRIMRNLGVRDLPWPNPEACDGVAGLLRHHGFTIRDDRRHRYTFPIETPADAALLLAGLYLPHTDADRLAAATRALSSRARPGRRLPFPLRRVIAQLD